MKYDDASQACCTEFLFKADRTALVLLRFVRFALSALPEPTSLLSTLLDALLSRIHRSLALRLLGHLLVGFGGYTRTLRQGDALAWMWRTYQPFVSPGMPDRPHLTPSSPSWVPSVALLFPLVARC